MLVISIVSGKGGVGKSTLSTSIAVAATRAGLGTILLDLDPQSTASTWKEAREADAPTVVAAHAPQLPSLLRQAETQGAEVVIIDTPPRADTAGVEAARVADLVLIPLQPSVADLWTVKASLLAAQIAARPATVVINGYLPSRITNDIADAITAAGVALCPVRLGFRVDFRHSLHAGQTPQEWAPSGKAAAEVTALWQWIVGTTGLTERPMTGSTDVPTSDTTDTQTTGARA